MIEQRESPDPTDVIDSFINQKHRFPFSNDDGDGLAASDKTPKYCNAGDVNGSAQSKGNCAISMPAGVERIEAYLDAGEDVEANVIASGIDMVEGQSLGHQEAGAQKSYAGQETSYPEGSSMAVVSAVPVIREEKKVGTLLAAAMRKYAVPRSSCYHGVTKLKWSGKFEAHLWDSTSKVEGRKRKGKHGITYTPYVCFASSF